MISITHPYRRPIWIMRHRYYTALGDPVRSVQTQCLILSYEPQIWDTQICLGNTTRMFESRAMEWTMGNARVLVTHSMGRHLTILAEILCSDQLLRHGLSSLNNTHTNRRLRTCVKAHKWNVKTSESAPSFSRWSGRWPCLGAAKKRDQLDHFWTCDLTHTIIPLMNTCVSRTFCMISGVIPTCSLTSMASPPAP